MFNYTAITYVGKNEINREAGNNIEALFIKMLVTCQGKFGDYNGEITDNRTNKIVRAFRACASE